MLSPESSCLLFKTDGLDSGEAVEFVLERVGEEGLEVARRVLWYVSDRELIQLRHASVESEFFDQVRDAYSGQTHEIVVLHAPAGHQVATESLVQIKEEVREQYAESFLVNCLHVPEETDQAAEFVLYERQLEH